MPTKQGKLKMLYYSDSPIATTGLGRLSRYLLPRFAEKFEITQVATNHHFLSMTPNGVFATYDHDKYKWEIVPTANQRDAHGIEIMKRLLSGVAYDVIFTSCDLNVVMPFFEDIMAHRKKYGSKWISYTPIDRLHLLDGEADIFTQADRTVVLSKYAKHIIEQQSDKKVDCIYHPLDLTEYPELTGDEIKKFRTEYFKTWNEDSWIVGNINRNTFRKDLVRTLFAFKEYSLWDKKAKLYMHTPKNDDGGDLSQNINETKIFTTDIAVPDISDASFGVPQDFLNKIFQSLNLMVSTSKGEGWGFSTVEAMATHTPLLVPNNTSFTEIVGADEERGWLIDCNEWVVDYQQSNCMRMIADTKSMVKQMKYIREHYDEAMLKTEVAHSWVRNHLNLDTIHEKWNILFKELLNV